MISLPRGWSYQKAVNMGMPYIPGNRCVICGRATDEFGYHSLHHITPKGSGQRYCTIGTHKVESPLMYLCGSGTTGCHNGFHGGSRYSCGWVWDNQEAMAEWFTGAMLDGGIKPHDDLLWTFGHYEIKERQRIFDKVLEKIIFTVEKGEICVAHGEWEERY